MINERINAGKCAAGDTECYPSCDRSQLFSNAKKAKSEKAQNKLKLHCKRMLKMC